MRIQREEGHHFAREILWNHDRRVVLTGASLLNCLRFTINNPVEVLIRAQRGNNLIANIDLQRHQIRLVPLVAISNRNPKILRIAKGSHEAAMLNHAKIDGRTTNPKYNDHGDRSTR